MYAATKPAANRQVSTSTSRSSIITTIVVAVLLVVAALIRISRSTAPLLALANLMRRLAGNDTDIDVPTTERQDEIGPMAKATSCPGIQLISAAAFATRAVCRVAIGGPRDIVSRA